MRKTPRYTQADIARQPKGGYRRSAETNLKATFQRIRQERSQEAAAKVTPLRKVAKSHGN